MVIEVAPEATVAHGVSAARTASARYAAAGATKVILVALIAIADAAHSAVSKHVTATSTSKMMVREAATTLGAESYTVITVDNTRKPWSVAVVTAVAVAGEVRVSTLSSAAKNMIAEREKTRQYAEGRAAAKENRQFMEQRSQDGLAQCKSKTRKSDSNQSV